jgi:hypothetical protein
MEGGENSITRSFKESEMGGVCSKCGRYKKFGWKP